MLIAKTNFDKDKIKPNFNRDPTILENLLITKNRYKLYYKER